MQHTKFSLDELNAQAWELNRKDPKQAIQLALEALTASRANADRRNEAMALKTLGQTFVWIAGYEQAFNYSLEAYKLLEELGDLQKQAQVCYGLGTNFYYLSDYDHALKWYSQCYEINSRIQDHVGVAEALNGMGTIYYTTEQNQEAEDVLKQSLEILLQHPAPQILPRVLDGLGETYYNLKNYEIALDYYFKCLDAVKATTGLLQVEAFALDGIGRTYAGMKEFEKAQRYYEESLSIRRNISFKVGEANSLINIGKMLLAIGDQLSATDKLHEALQIAREIDSWESVYKASELMSQLFETSGKYKEAFEYYKLFHAAREKVRDEKMLQRSKSLEMQFKMEKAEAEKQILERTNTELRQYFNDLVILNEIGNKITSSLSVDEIVATSYTQVNGLMDATGFGIGIYMSNANTLVFPLYIEDGERMENIVYDLDDTNRLSIQCYMHKKEIVINNFPEEINKYIRVVQAPKVGKQISSLIYLPLQVKDKTLGVITVQSFEFNKYTDYHVNILRSIGNYCAIALENALIYESVEKTVEERTRELLLKKEEIEKAYENTRLLSEIGQQLTSSLNLDTIFTKLHYYVNQLMDASCFGVRIYNDEEQTVEYKFEIERGERLEPLTVSMEDTNNYSVWCIINRKEIFINDNLTEYSRYVNTIRVVSGDMPHSLIFYPITVNDKVLGVITVQSFERNAYLPYHLDILKSLGAYAAIALENANLYESLEDKVVQRTAEVIRQKEIIEEKNKDITDSILYAKKIQQAILPPESEIKVSLPNSFVYYKPKDIVSGDFYWHITLGDYAIFAVADCTGHGVPGAFMSAICTDLMNHVIRDNSVTTPGKALQMLDKKLQQMLNKSEGQSANDGMDIALCALHLKTNVLQYAGAHRPMIVIRDGEILEFKPTKLSIGGYNTEEKLFKDYEIVLQKNDLIYLFTDGITDQFGGPKGKKFKYRQLKELLREIKEKNMDMQKDLLEETVEKWRSHYEQVDDILLFGVQV